MKIILNDFENFSPNSKVWVYQFKEQLSKENLDLIANQLQIFCKDWTAHDILLKAKSTIYKNHFPFIWLNSFQCFNARFKNF